MDKNELLRLLRDDPDVRAAVRELIGDLITQEPPPPSPAAVASLKAALRPSDLGGAYTGPMPIRARSSTPEDRRPGWLRK